MYTIRQHVQKYGYRISQNVWISIGLQTQIIWVSLNLTTTVGRLIRASGVPEIGSGTLTGVR